MNKEFIPYQEAKALQKLGFNERCLGNYYKDKTFAANAGCPDGGPNSDTFCTYTNDGFTGCWYAAPLWQQAFRWFREKGFDGEVMPYNINRREAKILGVVKGKRYVFTVDDDLPELKKNGFFQNL